MCGLAGIARTSERRVDPDALARMAAALRHRGPDGYGYFLGRRAGLAHVRLSILDRETGAQPLADEGDRLQVVFNGEIYNYVELREELRRLGHVFRTASDTEVLLHGYESWGERLVERLNGEFAFAIYDTRDDSVFLARDPFGVRPLFYAIRGGDLYFASEAKAIFATGEVSAAPDPRGFDEVFTLWAARAPATVFKDVWQLEPGTHARWRGGALKTLRYFTPLPNARAPEPMNALERLDEAMRQSVSIRLRADVPVGAYLSGGLDSTITCTLAAERSPHQLRTFSIRFDDPRMDEGAHQRLVAETLRSRHVIRHIGADDIARVFPSVVRHAETPLVRTAPAPLFLLAEATRNAGIVCVLTGEGSDELFGGYDLFKEVKVREFCRRRPSSPIRPLLFDRLYPYLGSGAQGDMWRRALLTAGAPGDPLDSHLSRFRLTSRIKEFLTLEWRAELATGGALGRLRDSLPAEFGQWTAIQQATFLEMETLLSSYLLSSQGDRMAMAHGVEVRFPFLDPELFRFASSLPDRSKLCGLREKEILRRWARDVIPRSIAARRKQPYRSPDAAAFFGEGMPEYVRALLTPAAIQRAGFFQMRAVQALIARCQAGKAVGFGENQAMVAIISTQLWHQEFVEQRPQMDMLPWARADVRTVALPDAITNRPRPAVQPASA